MSIVDLIYQETKGLPENEAKEVLDFVEFLKAKRQRILQGVTQPYTRNSGQEDAGVSELDQFGSVYDGGFDRDACYDRPSLP